MGNRTNRQSGLCGCSYFWKYLSDCDILAILVFPVVLHGSEEYNLSKGNHLADDKPDVDHLDVRGGRQALHLADEDGGHHQHSGQVHTQGRLKEERLEEGGGKSDRSQKKGWEVGGHHLADDLPFHHHNHAESLNGHFGHFWPSGHRL